MSTLKTERSENIFQALKRVRDLAKKVATDVETLRTEANVVIPTLHHKVINDEDGFTLDNRAEMSAVLDTALASIVATIQTDFLPLQAIFDEDEAVYVANVAQWLIDNPTVLAQFEAKIS